MPEQQKKHEFPIIPFMLLGVLIINSAVLAYKYINFYYFKDILADIHSLACTTDCDAVMLSKYALLFGIPTPVFGLASFSLLCYMFSRIHFGTQHPDLKTKAERTGSRLRRTNDRNVRVISSDAEDASHVSGSYPSKQKYKLDLSSLHEDHEDDENAEIGVSLHALESELEKIQRVFETFLILLVLIALSYMYIMLFTLELVCKFCMLSHVTLFLFAAYYFIYYKRFSTK